MISTSLTSNLPALMGYGGILAVLGGSAFAWVKGIPQTVENFILNQFTVRVTIRDTDPLFPSLMMFFHKQEHMKKCKRLLAQCADLTSSWGYEAGLDSNRIKQGIVFSRAPGKHLIFYKRRPIFFDRQVDEKKAMANRTVESLVLRAWGKNNKILKELLDDAKTEIEKQSEGYLDVRVSTTDGWSHVTGSRKRLLESVVLPQKLHDFVVTDLSSFLGKSEFYYRTGTPYHRGYLLEGPPGGGKSSLVQALATHFDSPLYVLDLKGINTDEKLRTLFRNISKKSFLLIEDIDTVFLSESRKNKDGDKEEDKVTFGITLGGLLNVLDGVFAADGLVVFMTTNHPEKLDSALIRPGRIDEKIHLGYATTEQANALYHKFFSSFDGADEFSEQTKHKQVSMAELQEQLVSRALGKESE